MGHLHSKIVLPSLATARVNRHPLKLSRLVSSLNEGGSPPHPTQVLP
jgi:hypothetical protein